MTKKLLIIFTLFFSYSAYANEGASDVENYVNDLVSDSVAVLENANLDANEKSKKIKYTLEKNLDAKWMAKFTLGRTVKTLPKTSVEKFIQTYRDYMVTTYAKGLNEYRGQKVEVKSYDDLGNGFYIVKTNIIGHTDQPIHVDYLVRHIQGSYKVRDIITEGISLVNSQRSEYASALENEGLEHLISELKKRTDIKNK